MINNVGLKFSVNDTTPGFAVSIEQAIRIGGTKYLVIFSVVVSCFLLWKLWKVIGDQFAMKTSVELKANSIQ